MYFRDVGFTGQTCDIVRHALNKLNDLIAVQQDGEQALFKPRLGIPHVIDLLQHSNLVCILEKCLVYTVIVDIEVKANELMFFFVPGSLYICNGVCLR